VRPARVVIIGNGIAGITAALELRAESKDAHITVVSDETELFYSRTALMYVYMRELQFADTVVHPRQFYKKRGINLAFTKATAIDCNRRVVETADGAALPFDYLLLAPGSKPRMPGVPGETLDGVQGLYGKQHLETLERNTQKKISRAVIVGGGLIGVELAEMLNKRKIPVTFLVRDQLYFRSIFPEAEAQLVTDEIRRHGIDLRLDTKLKAIAGDAGRNVAAVVTDKSERIECNLVGLTVGVEPKLELAAGTPIKTSRGFLTDTNLATSAPGIFAAGDAAEVTLPGGKPQVQQLWYTGRMQGRLAGLNLARSISGRPLVDYDPGIFFNSAKFFSLEYQTYGVVPAGASAQDSLLWHTSEQKKLIRIAFGAGGGEPFVTGFNVLGIRYRHEVCEKWIREKTPLAKVVASLSEANFDPEFYPHFENEMKRQIA
jgi:NADPH-dependent 2,4-dienoyl-CoA reductase/sulfur reductase-like enzyme